MFSVAEAYVYPVLMTMPRLIVIFAVVPFLSGKALTGGVRGGVVGLFAMFFSPAAGNAMKSFSMDAWIVLIGKELLIGLLLGLAFGLFIWAIESVGDLIDFQTGSANATFFDPVSKHEGGPTSSFLTQLAVTLFMATGGLVLMLNIVVESYRIWPVTSFFPRTDAVLEMFIVRQTDSLFFWIIKLATPVILVLLLAELGIGLVSRFVPQLNVFVFAQPLKSLLATLMMILFLSFVYESLQGFLQPGDEVLAFMKSVL